MCIVRARDEFNLIAYAGPAWQINHNGRDTVLQIRTDWASLELGFIAALPSQIKCATLCCAGEVVVASIRLECKAHPIVNRARTVERLPVIHAFVLKECWIDLAFE